MNKDKEKFIIDSIDKLEKEFDKMKHTRLIKTFLLLSIAFYLLALWLGWMHNLKDYLLGIFGAAVFAGFYIWINLLIFAPIINGAIKAAVILERLHTELDILRKE